VTDHKSARSRAAGLSSGIGQPVDAILTQAKLEAESFVAQEWAIITSVADRMRQEATVNPHGVVIVTRQSLDQILTKFAVLGS
jgi:hypothetical protein